MSELDLEHFHCDNCYRVLDIRNIVSLTEGGYSWDFCNRECLMRHLEKAR